MERQTGRIGLYLIMIVALVAGYFYLNKQVTTQSDYSLEQLQEALEGQKVQSAVIRQNREVPTGEVQVVLAQDGQRRMCVRSNSCFVKTGSIRRSKMCQRTARS